MKDAETLDSFFREVVAAMDAGDAPKMERLLTEHPQLATERLDAPGDWLRDQVGNALNGFFARPFLLWFVAEDPVRNGKLPENIAESARLIIQAAERGGADNRQEQLDYALMLVCWSWIARECGVQIALLDVLADAGAFLDAGPNNALVNGNIAAAEHLVQRGATLTLATALCLGRWEEAERLVSEASAAQKQFGLTLAALNGNAEALARLIPYGVNLNEPSADLYSHATALHHAVSSGSLAAVKTLVEAGADIGAKDTAYQGTPLGWAEHYLSEQKPDTPGKEYAQIVAYLREKVSQS